MSTMALIQVISGGSGFLWGKGVAIIGAVQV
jgi:hypothetical protein